jgi:hypothetical protein
MSDMLARLLEILARGSRKSLLECYRCVGLQEWREKDCDECLMGAMMKRMEKFGR